ncbi:hypothetical protein BH24ACT10_BH24ACT10_02420 [soil metagenome]
MLRRAPSRIAGVDVARGVALLGMAAVHVLPGADPDGSASWTGSVFAGRSAALFAVLAGVGLALGYRRPGARDALALVVRAVLIGLLGLWLGDADSGVAVILSYYAVLFVLVLPWLRAGPWVLLHSAAAVAVVVPLLSWAFRDELPERDVASPVLADLAEPGQLLSELLVTGYYPATSWLAYLLVGMAVGRLALQRTRTALLLAGAGAGLALAAHGVSALLLGPLGGYDRIAEQLGLPPGAVVEVVAEGRFGSVPTTTSWWLATDAPHSTTPLDLAATTGTALLVLGVALLLVGAVPLLLHPLAAAGSMPLSLYAAHVWVLGATDSDNPTRYYLLQVAGALLLAVLWRRTVGRGPLESVVALSARPLRRQEA